MLISAWFLCQWCVCVQWSVITGQLEACCLVVTWLLPHGLWWTLEAYRHQSHGCHYHHLLIYLLVLHYNSWSQLGSVVWRSLGTCLSFFFLTLHIRFSFTSWTCCGVFVSLCVHAYIVCETDLWSKCRSVQCFQWLLCYYSWCAIYLHVKRIPFPLPISGMHPTLPQPQLLHTWCLYTHSCHLPITSAVALIPVCTCMWLIFYFYFICSCHCFWHTCAHTCMHSVAHSQTHIHSLTSSHKDVGMHTCTQMCTHIYTFALKLMQQATSLIFSLYRGCATSRSRCGCIICYRWS